ncbi:hypothetical protein [Streptomyces sp. NPDC056452]|uniref:hypothetical protein n=1 Tax=Streptomyces sp. NPDC056452 TaxID=3345821 RepID=UPI00368062A8
MSLGPPLAPGRPLGATGPANAQGDPTMWSGGRPRLPRTGSARPAADGRNASAQVSAGLQHRPAPRGLAGLIVPGLALTSVGLALLTGVAAGGSYATHRLPGVLLIDFGFALAFMLLLATATGGLSPQDSGGTSASSRPRGVVDDVCVTHCISALISALGAPTSVMLLVPAVREYRSGASALRLVAGAVIFLSASYTLVRDARRLRTGPTA